MTREEIDEKVCEIMRKHGPDGHVDGHDKITDFVMSLSGYSEGQMREAYDAGYNNVDSQCYPIEDPNLDFIDFINRLNQNPSN